MVRVGFRACGFGSGRARATENFHGFISGCNISSSGHIRAAFGPHLGHIWAAFGPHLGRIWTFEAQKNTIFGIPNIICSKFIQKWLIIWERAYIFLNHGSNFLNSGHSGQENITSGYYGPSIMWPGSGRATQKPWPTGQISGRVLARPSPNSDQTQTKLREALTK